MAAMADFVEEDTPSGRMIRFTGRLTLARLGDLPTRLAKLDIAPSAIDLSSIERIDTVGAWIAYKLAKQYDANIMGASAEALRLIDLVDETSIDVQVRPTPLNPAFRVLNEIGGATIELFRTLKGLLGFFGAIMIALWGTLLHPSRLRVNAIVQRFELVGVRALGIIGVMNFLVGIVIAQQGAAQLAEFGAQGMTVNLVGRLTLRELGVLMTAIMVAGRSGSAFAAQLGTMKLTEEVDAMRTIGVSPMEALVLPRMFAVILLMPLLSFFAALMAIIGGGLLCWTALDIGPTAYIQGLQDVVPITDVWVGLIKAPVFGAIIAMTGCYQGLQVKSNAEEVGQRTTAAVVQAIFLIIVLDAMFAVFFSAIGWD